MKVLALVEVVDTYQYLCHSGFFTSLALPCNDGSAYTPHSRSAMGQSEVAIILWSINSYSIDSHHLFSGLRVYLIKDDLSTLPEARKKWNK